MARLRTDHIEMKDEAKLAIEMAEADAKAGKPHAVELKARVKAIVQDQMAKRMVQELAELEVKVMSGHYCK